MVDLLRFVVYDCVGLLDVLGVGVLVYCCLWFALFGLCFYWRIMWWKLVYGCCFVVCRVDGWLVCCAGDFCWLVCCAGCCDCG